MANRIVKHSSNDELLDILASSDGNWTVCWQTTLLPPAQQLIVAEPSRSLHSSRKS